MKILNIFHELLMEDFKSQRKKFIEQGYEPDIVDTYLKDFDEIRKAKYREARETEIQGLNVPKGEPRFNVDNYKTLRELEILVDFVAGQRKVGSANFEDIKVDGEPIFRNEDVEIYYADTPRACIQYKGNFPYSWCVARNNAGNMFYNYRLREYEPAFYFVKQIKRTQRELEYWNNNAFNGTFNDAYHFFVVQVTKYGKYIVTSAKNDGDKQMEWLDILKNAPTLLTLKHIFQPKPLSKGEREKIKKYQEGLSDEEFAKLPYKEKDLYMSVYKGNINRQILTNRQFDVLPEDLKNKYVGFGVGLSDEQFELIKDNKSLLKRYSEITRRKFDEFAKKFDKDITFTKSEQLFIQDKIDDFFVEKGDKLNSLYIHILLKYSSKKDELIDYYLNLNGDKLNSDYIGILLKYSTRKDEHIDYYLNLKGDKLNIDDIVRLFVSKDILDKKYDIIDKYINLKKDRLTNEEVYKIISLFSFNNWYAFKQEENERERIIIKLINNGVSKYAINKQIKKFNKFKKDEYYKIQLISELNEQIIRIKSIITLL